MKRDTLQNVIGFIFKYIWLICILMIVVEIVSTTYVSTLLMKETVHGMLDSVSSEVTGRVDGVLRLLDGISTDERFSDTNVPIYDRAIQTRSYQKSYNLFMIAFTDENVNVVSSDETTPPTELTSLAHRGYMQKLYATGQPQITDAFPAGSDGVTMNYTIAVPIMKEDKVAGSVFGSIYFADIEEILTRNISENRFIYLLGENNTIMTNDEAVAVGTPFLEANENANFIGISKEQVEQSLRENGSGSYWIWENNQFSYVAYSGVENTNWKIIYEATLTSVIRSLFPTLILKSIFYVGMCAIIAIVGKKYLNKHLADINHLVNRISTMQRELFDSEQTNYDNILELTQTGLTDHLTGLSTRAVLLSRMEKLINENTVGAVMFIDLDDLKRINDSFGHEAGDCALLHFAKVLKTYETHYDALAARYGGDEFIMVLHGKDKAAVEIIAKTFCEELNTALTVNKNNFSIHGSIGIAFYPENGNDPETLICKADLALYSAKQDGKARYELYEEKK